MRLWKLLCCLFLNAIGIHRFNHSKVISFNKPPDLCDRRETLDYSFNLQMSMHPHSPYQKDIQALGNKYVILIGSDDEANDPAKYPEIMQTSQGSLQVIEKVKHFEYCLPSHCNGNCMQLD